VVLDDMQNKLIKHGVRYAETGPMLEINDHILAQWQRFSGVQHKRRRCFVKELSESKDRQKWRSLLIKPFDANKRRYVTK
jgi:hypothetical protein